MAKFFTARVLTGHETMLVAGAYASGNRGPDSHSRGDIKSAKNKQNVNAQPGFTPNDTT
jgi:hypothetical protein